MKLTRILMVATVAVWPATILAAPLEKGARVAFLGVHFTDMSTEGAYNGIREDEVARVALAEEYVAGRFTDEGFEVASLEPVAGDLEKVLNPAKCNGCDVKFAEELGARYVVVSEVYKISNLIQSLNIRVRDVATGETVKGRAVDIRGNTDKAWIRGMAYVLDNYIFTD
jgi:hypothetical protein